MSKSVDDSVSRTTTDDLRFRKSQHLRKPAEFERVYQLKRKAGDGRLLVFAAPNALGMTRIGLSVSRRHGGSVRRQRLKRLLREAFRLSQHELPAGLDLVLIPRAGGEATVPEYRKSLGELCTRLNRRIEQDAARQSDAKTTVSENERPTPGAEQ